MYLDFIENFLGNQTKVKLDLKAEDKIVRTTTKALLYFKDKEEALK